jgi:hypothetical protein
MIGLLLIAQLTVAVHGPDTASTCAPIDVTVASRAPGALPPRISLGPLPASVQFLKSNLATRVERDGAGHVSSLTEGTFTFTVDAPARVTLPGFTAVMGRAQASATPSPITVHPSGTLPPTVLVRAWLDRGGNRGPVDSLQVGQQMDYVVDVHLNEAARQRLRRNPTFFPPEMPGVLAYDLAAPSAVTRTGRRCFETLSYRRALFPLFAGRSVIAPAALTYSLPLSTSFFSREETFELRTDSVRFVALDVPAAGRPAGFGGAVGALSISSKLSASDARMGDPVVLTVRIEGTGNVKLWPRPSLKVPWGMLADGAERVDVDTSASRVRGAKEFDWLLTPRSAGHQELPKIEYPYFDAERSEYSVASAPPLSLDVASASLATLDSAPVNRMPIRRVLRAETSEPLSSQPWFWLLLAIAPVPAVVRRANANRMARHDTRTNLQRVRALSSSSAIVTPRELRRIFLGALDERTPGISAAARSTDFARALRRAGVSVGTSDEATTLLEQLDAAAFSSTAQLDADMRERVVSVVNDVDQQAIRPSAIRSSGTRTLLLVAFLTATTVLAVPPALETTFIDAVQAYDHGAFTTAQRLFSRVATRAPRAVDAWANVGTAAWARGDTAAAVVGWQRALRLDPLDNDARERLGRVQPPVMRTPGYVPPIPLNALAIAALVLWIGAWMVFAIPHQARPAQSRAYAIAGMTVASVILLGAMELRDHLDVRGLGVLRETRMLLDAPSARTAAASGAVGETGTLGAREGAWVHISLDNARSGWVPLASVLPMESAPANN